MTSGCGQDAMREQCRLVAQGVCKCSFLRTACPRGVLGVWRGWLAYTAPASGAPRGYKTSSASIGIGYPECIFHTRPSAFK